MKNVFNYNSCNSGTVQLHMETPPIPLIKIKIDEKLDNFFVRVKFCRYPMSQKSDLYEFKMNLFVRGDPVESCCSS